jgi:hypothetical protein
VAVLGGGDICVRMYELKRTRTIAPVRTGCRARCSKLTAGTADCLGAANPTAWAANPTAFVPRHAWGDMRSVFTGVWTCLTGSSLAQLPVNCAARLPGIADGTRLFQKRGIDNTFLRTKDWKTFTTQQKFNHRARDGGRASTGATASASRAPPVGMRPSPKAQRGRHTQSDATTPNPRQRPYAHTRRTLNPNPPGGGTLNPKPRAYAHKWQTLNPKPYGP